MGYRSIGPLSIPYPTFSVSTRPLSSYIGSSQIATPLLTSVPDHEIRRLQNAPGANVPQGGTTNNYFQLLRSEFNRAIEYAQSQPGAQARAAGLP